jgi:hypothetical protein
VYAKIEANGRIAETATMLVLAGVNGLLIEGEIGLKAFTIGSDNMIPLEIAIPLADEALARKLLHGKPLRNMARIIASGNVRGPDDAFKIMALGADAIESTMIAKIAQLKDPGNTSRNLVDGYTDELKVMIGAGGISSVASLVANRNLLRTDEMPTEMRTLLGIAFMGK